MNIKKREKLVRYGHRREGIKIIKEVCYRLSLGATGPCRIHAKHTYALRPGNP